MACMVSAESVDGPRVATILVLRDMMMKIMRLRHISWRASAGEPTCGGNQAACLRPDFYLPLLTGLRYTVRHGAAAARASNTATAGSCLPSRNSRNAPPPVEM